jgi:hypothetical protein
MREQRDIVMKRFDQIFHEKSRQILFNQVPLTKPVDT